MRDSKHRLTFVIVMLLAAATVHGQGAGRLSQKLLLENTLQQRVTNAMTRILDESQFVVDVKVELAFAASPSSTGTVMRGADGQLTTPQTGGATTGGITALPETATDPTAGTAVPFPIPGFPNVTALRDDEPVRVLDDADDTAAADADDELFDELVADEKQPLTFDDGAGLPRIKSMSVSIILEDGVSPQTIENVRQVALVASRYDRDRGDVLSITTASFKDRAPGSRFTADISAEDLLAQTPAGQQISQENESLKETLREAELRNEQLMQDIRNREMEYLAQSEEERKKALADLANIQNERAKDLMFLQQQREDTNLKITEALLEQIDALREDMSTGILSQREQDIKTAQATSLEDSLTAMRQAFEQEKEQLQQQIEAALNPTPIQPQGTGGLMSGPGLLIAGGMLFLLLLALILTMTMRNRAPVPAMAYASPYPPRRKKRKPKSKPAPEPEPEAPKDPEPVAQAAPVAVAPVAQVEEEADWTPPETGENPDVLQAELKSIRQSVVSMSVGEQDTASRILNDWLSSESGDQSGGALDAGDENSAENGESEGAED